MIRNTVIAALYIMLSAATASAAGLTQEEYYALRRLIGQGEYDRARRQCEALLERYPKEQRLYEAFAEVVLYAGGLDEGERFFRQRLVDGTSVEYSLYGLGLIEFYQRRYPAAVETFTKAIETGNRSASCYKQLSYSMEKVYGTDETIRRLSVLSHEHPGQASIWYALGLSYWSKKDYAEALRSLNEAMMRDVGEPAYHQAKTVVGVIARKVAMPERSLRRSMIQAKAAGDLEGESFLRSYLLMLLSQDTERREWQSLVDAALYETHEFGMARWCGWTYEKLAEHLLRVGKPNDAVIAAIASLQESKIARDDLLAISASKRLLDANLDIGKYDRVLDTVLREYQIVSEQGDLGEAIIASLVIARYLNELGRNDLALVIAVDALTKAKAIKENPMMLFYGFTTLGSIYEALGAEESAKHQFVAAEEFEKRIYPGMQLATLTQGYLGRLSMSSGNLRRAYHFFKKQIHFAERANLGRERTYGLINLGEYWERMGRYDIAGRYFELARKIALQRGLRSAELLSLTGIQRLAEREGRPEKVVELCKRVIQCVDSSCGLLVFPEGTTSLEKKAIQACRLNAIWLARLGQQEEAFGWAEEVQRRYRRSVYRMAQIVSGSAGTSDKDSVVALLKSYRENMAVLESGDDGAMPGRVDAILKLLTAERGILDMAGRKSLGRANTDKRTILLDVQKSLAHDEALLEFVVGENEMLVFFVRAEELSVRTVQIGRRALQVLVQETFPLNDFSFHISGGTLDRSFNFDSAERLSHVLLDSAESLTGNVRKWIIVPDGILHSVPFDALVAGAKKEGRRRFIVEDHEIIYKTTAGEIGRSATNSQGGTAKMLLVPHVVRYDSTDRYSSLGRGNAIFPAKLVSLELPGAKSERDNIVTRLGGVVDVLSQSGDMEAEFERVAGEYAVIHVISHGSTGRWGTMGSAVEFATGSDASADASEYWTPVEALLVPWRGELVVLSACGTARSMNGEEPGGFIQALQASGIPCVVGSLGAIDDRTAADLMDLFYTGISEGMTPGAAMQRAKVRMIASGVDPLFWSQFVVYGDASPQLLHRPGTPLERWATWQAFAAVTLVLLCLLFAGWRYRRGRESLR